MNSGLMNIRGNLIRTVKIIVFCGISVGETDKMTLKQEKENAAARIPRIIMVRFIVLQNEKIIRPKNSGTIEKIAPKIKEAHISPISTVFIEIGVVINLSSVLFLVSQGKVMGPIEVADKKSTIVINPDMMWIGWIFLPIVKAKNNIIGNKIDWITTGPLL